MNFTIRHQGDGYIRDDVNWQRAEVLRVNGEGPTDFVAITAYPYGMSVNWRHDNPATPGVSQLEFHVWQNGGMHAVATFKCWATYNVFQVREVWDRTSMELRFPKVAAGWEIGDPAQAEIGTEHANISILVNPQGDLILAPQGNVMVGAETLEAFVRRIVASVLPPPTPPTP